MRKLLQPISIGIILFGATAVILSSAIISNHMGSRELAAALLKWAQPLCSMAVAVLMYLWMCERQRFLKTEKPDQN